MIDVNPQSLLLLGGIFISMMIAVGILLIKPKKKKKSDSGSSSNEKKDGASYGHKISFEKVEKIRGIKVPCKSDAGATVTKDVFFGFPEPSHHPLNFQDKAMKEKGTSIPDEIMQAVEEVQGIASRNATPEDPNPFPELCHYVLMAAKNGNENATSIVGEKSEDQALPESSVPALEK